MGDGDVAIDFVRGEDLEVLVMGESVAQSADAGEQIEDFGCLLGFLVLDLEAAAIGSAMRFATPPVAACSRVMAICVSSP